MLKNTTLGLTVVLALLTGLALDASAQYRAKGPRYTTQSPTTSHYSASSYSTYRSRPAPEPAPAAPGQVRCVAEENGASASATIEVRTMDRRLVASGNCSDSIELPAGDYLATVTLTTALDRPTSHVGLRVASGSVAYARARFSTAIVEVRFTESGRAASGRAVFYRNGQAVGSLGSGVPARISAGTYEVTAHYGSQERTYSVSVVEGQRRAVQARF